MRDMDDNPLADLDDDQLDYFTATRRRDARRLARSHREIDDQRDLALADAMNDIEDDYQRSVG